MVFLNNKQGINEIGKISRTKSTISEPFSSSNELFWTEESSPISGFGGSNNFKFQVG